MNASISSYFVDGLPANPISAGNKGRRQALGYAVGKRGERMKTVMSFPVKLNNYNAPTLKEAASILRGDSVEAAMLAFNMEQEAKKNPAYVAKLEAVAQADAYANNAGLPTYSELSQAANALACDPDNKDLRLALGRILDKIPGC